MKPFHDNAEVHTALSATGAAWKPVALAALFGGIKASQRQTTCLLAAEVTVEVALIETLVDLKEDAWPDERGIKIDSGDKFFL
ncbi:hypothetical protein HWV62_28744 [Athelia sp. TMB]|nr:hypothetical protein HWV62_28744 [Athelia sp. TMB]